METLYLSKISLEELLGHIRQIVLEEACNAIRNNKEDRFLTIGEVKSLLKISRPTVNRMREAGTLTEYFFPPIERPRFKESQVLQTMKQIRKFKNNKI